MKTIINILTILLIATTLQNCAPLPENISYGLAHGEPFSSPYIQILQEEYKKSYPSVDLTTLEFYVLSHKDINEAVCTGFTGQVGGCTSLGYDLVFMSDLYLVTDKSVCAILAHEMFHKILHELGESNGDNAAHTNDEWHYIDTKICDNLVDID